MEGLLKINKQNICDEVNAESKNNFKTISSLSHELKNSFAKDEKSVFGEYDLFVPEQVKFIFSNGLLQQRRSPLSSRK